MGKADASIDYYKILGCAPTAGTDEVKKCFKKLALVYHPDRNPGREVEFNAKFQEIQAANELLTDEQRRARYDADRIKAGLVGGYMSPAAPNVPPRYAPPNVPFPPPPRRTQPQKSPQHAGTKAPPAGAGRYSQFGGSSDRPSRPPYGDDQRAKTNAYKAWENIRSSQSASGRSATARPTRPRAETAQSPLGGTPRNSGPRTRADWDEAPKRAPASPGMSRASTVKTPRKNGFDPATPGGDEPAAPSSSAYFNIARGGRPQASYPQPPYPPPPCGPPPVRADPFRGYRTTSNSEDPFSSNDRLSTPYATMSGEKTYFSSVAPNRSASHATNLHTTGNGHISPGSWGRHRSASPSMSSSKPQHSSSSSDAPDDDDDDIEMNRKDRECSPERRASADPRFCKPRAPGEDEVNGFSKAQKRSTWEPQSSPSVPETTRNIPPTMPASRKDSISVEPESLAQRRMKQPADRDPPLPQSPLRTNAPWNSADWETPIEMSKSWQEHYGSKENGNTTRQFERPPDEPKASRPALYGSPEYNSSSFATLSTDHCSRRSSKPSSSKPLRTCKSPWPYWAIPSSVTPERGAEAGVQSSSSFRGFKHNVFSDFFKANPSHHSFSFPSSSAASAASSKHQSTDNIHTAFSSADWHGKFNSDATDYLEPQRNRAARLGRNSSPPKGHGGYSKIHSRSRSVAGNGTYPTDSFSQAPPPPPRPTAPQATSPVKFSPDEWNQLFKEGTWAYPLPPPPQSPRTATAPRQRPAKKLSTVKRKPPVPKPASVTAAVDGDDGDNESVLAESFTASEASRTTSNGSAMDVDSGLTPPVAHPQHHKSVSQPEMVARYDPIAQIIRSAIPPVWKSEVTTTAEPDIPPPTDLDDDDLELNDLKDTAPFVPSSAGLHSLEDLSTTLPFESAPSHTVSDRPPKVQRLKLPNPPKAPDMPDTVTPAKFEGFMRQMNVYLREWNAFNERMLAHFRVRQEDVHALPPDWVSTIGSTSYDRYLCWMEEDERVRAHWDVSWEKHRDAMIALGDVRKAARTAKTKHR